MRIFLRPPTTTRPSPHLPRTGQFDLIAGVHLILNEQMLQRFLDFESKTWNQLQQKHISFSEWWQVEDVASDVLCVLSLFIIKNIENWRLECVALEKRYLRQYDDKCTNKSWYTHIKQSMDPSVTTICDHLWSIRPFLNHLLSNSKSHWVSIFRTGRESWDGTLVFQIPCLVSRSLDFHTRPNKVFRASKTSPSQGMTGGFWKD